MQNNENIVITKGALKLWSFILSLVMVIFSTLSFFIGKWVTPFQRLAVLEQRIDNNSKNIDKIYQKIENLSVIVDKNKSDIYYIKGVLRDGRNKTFN